MSPKSQSPARDGARQQFHQVHAADIAPSKTAQPAPTFIVWLAPQPGVDGIRSLRALLKVAKRRFGLRAIAAREGGGAL
jgi:hypothetical protein